MEQKPSKTEDHGKGRHPFSQHSGFDINPARHEDPEQPPPAYQLSMMTSPLGQAQHPIVVQIQMPKTKIKDKYNSKLSRNLAIVHLTLGGLAIILNCIGITISTTSHFFTSSNGTSHFPDNNHPRFGYSYQDTVAYYTGVGIWVPLLFFSFSGAYAICAGESRTRCKIVATMVFSILSSVAAAAMLSCALWAFVADIQRISEGFQYLDFGTSEYAHGAARSGWGSMVVSTFWILISLAEIVVCIWISALCCGATCCDSSTDAQVQEYRYTANTAGNGPKLVAIDTQCNQLSETPGVCGSN